MDVKDILVAIYKERKESSLNFLSLESADVQALQAAPNFQQEFPKEFNSGFVKWLRWFFEPIYKGNLKLQKILFRPLFYEKLTMLMGTLSEILVKIRLLERSVSELSESKDNFCLSHKEYFEFRHQVFDESSLSSYPSDNLLVVGVDEKYSTEIKGEFIDVEHAVSYFTVNQESRDMIMLLGCLPCLNWESVERLLLKAIERLQSSGVLVISLLDLESSLYSHLSCPFYQSNIKSEDVKSLLSQLGLELVSESNFSVCDSSYEQLIFGARGCK